MILLRGCFKIFIKQLSFSFNSEQRRLTIAGLLLSHGADPNTLDRFGWSMIHTCAWNDDLPLLKMCVRKGGKVNVPNYQQQLPVKMAFIRGNTEVVEYLETQSCDIKAQCRSIIRKAMTKKLHRVKELPLPPSLRLYINYECPYDGFEATLVPEAPWSVDQLSSANKEDLKQFIDENASPEFLEENKDHMDSLSELIDTFQSLYLWESFRTVNYEEPLPRAPRYSLDPHQVKRPPNYFDPSEWLT